MAAEDVGPNLLQTVDRQIWRIEMDVADLRKRRVYLERIIETLSEATT